MSKNPLSVHEQKKDFKKMAAAIAKAGNKATNEMRKKRQQPATFLLMTGYFPLTRLDVLLFATRLKLI